MANVKKIIVAMPRTKKTSVNPSSHTVFTEFTEAVNETTLTA